MKKISTYILMGVELVGLYLIHAHRYMQLRAIVYIVMACVAIIYFVCEFSLHIAKVNSIADIQCSANEALNFTEQDWKDIAEIIKEIEDKKDE